MDAGQIGRIFNAVNHDIRIDQTIERYAARKLKFKQAHSEIEKDGEGYSATLCDIRALVMWALEDFLKRGTKGQANAYREQSKTLKKAAALLKDVNDFHHYPAFAAMMTHYSAQGGPASGLPNQVLATMQSMAQSLEALATTHEAAEINNTFFYCLGRRFKKECGLPLPSANEAYSLFVVVVDAIRNESPALLDGMKTDYDVDARTLRITSGSEIRRLMKSGYSARG